MYFILQHSATNKQKFHFTPKEYKISFYLQN